MAIKNITFRIMENNREIKERKKVAELILQVLSGKIIVRIALEQFPENYEDESIRAAWHALVHYDSDDNLRRKDFDYAEVQDNYLQDIAFTLQKGEELPLNIINSYKDYYEPTPLKSPRKLKNKIKSFFRFLH